MHELDLGADVSPLVESRPGSVLCGGSFAVSGLPCICRCTRTRVEAQTLRFILCPLLDQAFMGAYVATEIFQIKIEQEVVKIVVINPSLTVLM